MHNANDSNPLNRRLGTWKEIAGFFGSDESTVRRWEKERGLPVHRLPGRSGSKVFAYTEELSRWLEQRPPDAPAEPVSVELQGSAPSVTAPAQTSRFTLPPLLAALGLLALATVGANFWLGGGTRESAQHPAIGSIAVLPLLNLTGDRGQSYLAAGLTDELITELSRITAIRVVSRTSVQQYMDAGKPLPQIARELDVDAVIEGSVSRSSEGGIRVNVQLLDARNDRHIWADTIERGIDQASSMQHDLAAEIADEIGVELTPFERQYFAGRHPVSFDSFRAYLMGRYYWNKRTPQGLAEAERMFRESIVKDRDNPLAYAGLADTYLLDSLYSRAATSETLDMARAAAAHAIALDASLAEAHCSMAYALFLQRWDFAGAEREYRLAIHFNPNYATAHQWYAEMLSVEGRHDAAIAEVRRAEELDPFSMIIHHEAGQILQNAREYPQALEEYAKAEVIAPGFPQPHEGASLAYRRLGRYDLALKELQLAAARDYDYFTPAAADAIASAYTKSGARGFLLAYVNERRLYPHSAYPLALGYAALGDRNAAFAALEATFRSHNLDMLTVQCSPEFDGLRNDTRYVGIVRRIGFPKRD
jgi:TolB-like protein/Tfp pilus assembly protein PilF